MILTFSISVFERSPFSPLHHHTPFLRNAIPFCSTTFSLGGVDWNKKLSKVGVHTPSAKRKRFVRASVAHFLPLLALHDSPWCVVSHACVLVLRFAVQVTMVLIARKGTLTHLHHRVGFPFRMDEIVRSVMIVAFVSRFFHLLLRSTVVERASIPYQHSNALYILDIFIIHFAQYLLLREALGLMALMFSDSWFSLFTAVEEARRQDEMKLMR